MGGGEMICHAGVRPETQKTQLMSNTLVHEQKMPIKLISELCYLIIIIKW